MVVVFFTKEAFYNFNFGCRYVTVPLPPPRTWGVHVQVFHLRWFVSKVCMSSSLASTSLPLSSDTPLPFIVLECLPTSKSVVFFVRGGGKFSLCKHNSACAPLGCIHLCTVPSKTDHCGGVCCLLMHCSESHFSSSPKSFVSELLYLKQKEDTLQGEAEGQHAKHTCCQVNVYCEFYSCIQLGALC